MKLKWILISVLLILLVAYVSGAPTTKSYNADTKTISLKSGQTTTTIQQISFTPSISSAEEVFKITTPLNVELKSFYNIRSSVSSGSGGMTGYEVYELVGGKWVTATTLHSGTYKFVYHKKAEVGHTSVQLIPSFSGVECPEFTWWDTDWLKRQTGTITNPSGSAGYEIKLDVTYDGDMQADFDDLRFVADDDTTELHYWIESKVDSTSAVVWIEAPASDTTFYMYYDNDAVSTTSSGEATFDFFDSFSGDAYNETDWTRNAGTATVSGGILAVTAGGSSWQGVYTDVSYGNNHATRARQKGATHASGNVASGFSNSINGGGGTHTADWYQAYTTTYVNYHYAKNNDGGSQSAAKSSDGTTYHTYDIIRNTTTSNLYKRDDSLEDTRTSSITAQSIPCVIQAYYSTSSIYTDWFLVRDYVYPEPTGSFGAEQPQVVAAFSANVTTGCAPIYIGFTDSSTGSPTSWDWDFGDGTAHSSDQNPVHEYTTYGTFTVVLIASTAYMSDSETKTDYITLGQAPTTGFSGNTTFGYPPFDIAFTGSHTGGEPDTWDWYFPNGGDAHTQNATWTFDYNIGNTPTCYDIQLNTSNECGFDWENKTSYICAYPLLASFTTNETEGCKPTCIQFTDTTSNGTATAWYWDFGDTETSNDQNPVHCYDDAGTYTVKLNASNLYSWDWENKTALITVGEPPVAAFSAAPLTGYVILNVAFTDASTGSPTAWYWDFGDGDTDTVQNPSHSYTTAGEYTVSLRVTNDCGVDWENKTDYVEAVAGAGNVTTTPLPGEMNIGTRVNFAEDTFVPFWLWAALASIGSLVFIGSVIGYRTILGTISMAMFAAAAFVSPVAAFFYSETFLTNSTTNEFYTYPITWGVMQPWVAWVMWGMALLSLILMISGVMESMADMRKPGDEFLEDNWLDKRDNL